MVGAPSNPSPHLVPTALLWHLWWLYDWFSWNFNYLIKHAKAKDLKGSNLTSTAYTLSIEVGLSLPDFTWFCGLPYRRTADITNTAPNRNCPLIWKSNRYTDTTHEMIIEHDVAKPFSMLSAYFTTTATSRPPNACMEMTIHTKAV